MTTDIDHLHKVINKEITGRCVGKTFAKCHEVAGILEVTDADIVFCVISLYRDKLYILPMLREVLFEHGFYDLKFIVAYNEVRVGDRRIKFVLEWEEEKMRGFSNPAIVYMRHYD